MRPLTKAGSLTTWSSRIDSAFISSLWGVWVNCYSLNLAFASLGGRTRRNGDGWRLKPAVFRISEQVHSCFGVWDTCIHETAKGKEGRKGWDGAEIRIRESEGGRRKTHVFDLYCVISETAPASINLQDLCVLINHIFFWNGIFCLGAFERWRPNTTYSFKITSG